MHVRLNKELSSLDYSGKCKDKMHLGTKFDLVGSARGDITAK